MKTEGAMRGRKSLGNFLLLLGLAFITYAGIVFARSAWYLDPMARERALLGASLLPSLLGLAALLAGAAALLAGHGRRRGKP